MENRAGIYCSPDWEELIRVDLIRERFLSHLEFSDLLTFCQLSQDFRDLSLPSIRRRSKIRFTDYFCARTKKSLDRFTKFWKMSKSQRTPSFPCTSFVFEFSSITVSNKNKRILGEKTLHQALSKFGVHIENLTLKWFYPIILNSKRRGEISVLEELGNVLCKTPNIRYLYFDYPAKCRWEVSSRSSRSALLLDDPEFIMLQSDFDTTIRPNLTKLEKLELGRLPLAKILEGIIQWSPKLKEVNLESFCEHFLASPVNRLHLLKNLVLHPPNTDLKAFEKAIFAIPDPYGEPILQLRRLWLNFSCFKREKVGMETELQTRIGILANRILASSSNTLVRIRWDGVTPLCGLRWTKVMPNLQSIYLGYPFYLPKYCLFPVGFNWSLRFPKLGLILLKGFSNDDIVNHFSGFKCCINVSEDEEIENKMFGVRKADFHHWVSNDDSDSEPEIVEPIITESCFSFWFIILFIFVAVMFCVMHIYTSFFKLSGTL